MKALKNIAWLLLFLLAAAGGWAQQFPDPPQPPRLVNDFAGMLTPGQREQLEAKLVQFDRQTSTQIAVVTVDDLQGLDASDYAARLFDRWGIGRSGNDNGILILAKPKTADSNGRVFISTGYGLEGAVPDALAGRIVDYDILPAFRQGNIYAGLDSATNTLMGLTRGEFTAQQYLDRHGDVSGGIFGLLIGGLILFFILVLPALGRRGRQGYTVDHTGGSIIPSIILGSLLGRSGGGFGGFSGGSGGGGFGGGGFGGFGGFGGGSTGGGGAGGSW